jgi:putative ubiquitin-RnfH superfamily antitoxin RatB of RatAB toxin-antitoxin module
MTTGCGGLTEVEVCWVEEPPGAAPQLCRHMIRLAAEATVLSAVEALGRADLTDRLSTGTLAAAIFGEHATLHTRLHPGDRIELVSGLRADPKLSRARRAEVQRARRGDVRWQRR